MTIEGPGCDVPYVCVSSTVGTIDDQSGAVTAGSGGQERTFALAILSVGDKVGDLPARL